MRLINQFPVRIGTSTGTESPNPKILKTVLFDCHQSRGLCEWHRTPIVNASRSPSVEADSIETVPCHLRPGTCPDQKLLLFLCGCTEREQRAITIECVITGNRKFLD